ncbi:LacI family transcriptional regulator [Devosia sp. Root436]|uniref:LacI family DNA-binding transcriptional regulator n=1 Tax=Devosia sp. Root436 TaxID=1736537 RepID=UPI0006F43B06|nr:LacI family DNA-binding transcriptional regulator [Devosia sp. Root436]KQX34328.1 LacI family transcriptional regulator [Devosia sp. Root436]
MAKKASPTGPTMIDVARAAGVSQSCVSLVLNDPPGARLSEATRQHVLATAKSLGYHLPERRARKKAAPAAGTGRNIIAYVVDELSLSPHPVLHVDGARDAAWAAECLLQVHVTRGNQAIETETLAAIAREPSVLGIIYATHFTREVEAPIVPRALPTVLVNCYTADRLHPTLLPGEVAGGFAATQHLLSKGHRRIAIIGGEAWMDASRDRLKGYREALATADIGADAELVREGDWTSASGYDHTIELMKLRLPPTAIFCANDLMALGAMEAISDLGLSVPGDVSVIGYNDLELSRHLRPPLTTCHVPNYDMGRRAVELLVDMALLDRSHRAMITKLEIPLVERATVAARTP